MGEPQAIIDEGLLKRFVPINALASNSLRQIAKKAIIAEYKPGEQLFSKGDRDGLTIYLLNGEIELLAGGQSILVESGSETARHPLGQHQPRQVDAVARGAVSCIQVETNIVDMVLTWQQSAVEVDEIEQDASEDWMTRMLQNTLFLKLPPANIQKIMMSMSDMEVKEGDTIIRQGEEGDYYYYIRSGRCEVLRQPKAGAREVKLAELPAGESFGEEALVSAEMRNATVRMLTDGILMRLSKKDFVKLIHNPLHNIVDYYKAEVLASDGAAWLDVRLPDEYANSHINDALNIPLPTLRIQLKQLDKSRPYIVYCDTGRRSATAAFLMSEKGFDAHVLGGGLMNLPPEVFLVSEHNEDANRASVEMISSQVLKAGAQAKTSPENKGDSRKTSRKKAAPKKAASKKAEPQKKAESQKKTEPQSTESPEPKTGRKPESEPPRRTTASTDGDGAAGKAGGGAQEALARAREALEQARQVKQRGVAAGSAPARGTAPGATVVALDSKQVDKAIEEAEAAKMLLQQELQRLETELASSNAQLEEMLMENQRLEVALTKQQNVDQDATDEFKRECESLREKLSRERQSTQERIDKLNATLQSRLDEQRDGHRRESQQLREQLESAQKAREQMEADLNAGRQDNEEATGQLRRERSELEQRLRSDGERHAEEIASLKGKLEVREQERNNAEQQRSQFAEEIERLRGERNDLERRLRGDGERHVEEVASLKAKLEARQQEKEHSERRHAQLAQEVEQLRRERSNLEQRLRSDGERHVEEIASLKGRLEVRQEERDDAEQRRSLLAVEVKQLRQNAEQQQSLSEEVERLRAAAERQTQELTALDGQLAEAREQKSIAEAARDELAKQINQVAADLETNQALSGELEHLRQQVGTLEIQIEEAVQARAAAEARAEQDAASSEQAKTEQQRTVEELDYTQRTLTKALIDKERLEKQLAEARNRPDSESGHREGEESAVTEELSGVRREVDELREALRKVTGERDEAQQSYQAAEQARREAEEAVELARNERKTRDSELKTELERLQNEINDYQSRLDEAQTIKEAAEQARATAEEQAGRAMAESGARHEELEGQIQEYQTVLARMEEELDQVGRITEEADSARKQSEGHVQRMAREMERLRNLLKDAEHEKDQAWQARKQAEQEMARARREAVDAIQKANDQVHKAQEDLTRVRSETDTEIQRRLELETNRFKARDVEPAKVRKESAHSFHGASTRTEREVTLGSTDRVRDTRSVTGRHKKQQEKKSNLGVVLLLILLTVGAVTAYVFKDQIMAMLGMGSPGGDAAETSTATPTLESDTKVSAAEVPSKSSAATSTAPKAVAKPAPRPTPKPRRESRIARGAEIRDAMRGGGVAPTMVQLPGGDFVMGDRNSTDPTVKPQHTVTIKPFAIGKFEVTFDEFDRFVQATGREGPDDLGRGRGRHPVVNVSWNGARAYAAWLSEQTGHRYRLPSESEWEYAARAGQQGAYWWGNAVGSGNANCFNCGSRWDGLQPAEVGRFRSNPLGVHDTAGNVAEWTQDCYQPNYKRAPVDGSAWQGGPCVERVVRGGSFASSSKALRSANRERFSADTRLDNLGFRLVREG